MKVALCLSGQPRFHSEESYRSLKREILDKYDTDVFIHTIVSSNENFIYPYAPWSGITSKIKISPNVVSELNTLYSPKKMAVEEPKTFPEFYKKGDYLSYNMPPMFYSIKYSDDLRKSHEEFNNFKYDFVIRARTDTLLSSLPDLSSLDKDTIYVPNNCPNPLVINDNFSICGGEVSDKAYNVFDNIWIYSEEGRDYSPEMMWTKHLKTYGIPFKKLDTIQQSFVRN